MFGQPVLLEIFSLVQQPCVLPSFLSILSPLFSVLFLSDSTLSFLLFSLYVPLFENPSILITSTASSSLGKASGGTER